MWGSPSASMSAAIYPPASSAHRLCWTALHSVGKHSRKCFELHGPPGPQAVRDDEAGLVRQTGSVHRGGQLPLRVGTWPSQAPSLPASRWPSHVPCSPRASLLLSMPRPLDFGCIFFPSCQPVTLVTALHPVLPSIYFPLRFSASINLQSFCFSVY